MELFLSVALITVAYGIIVFMVVFDKVGQPWWAAIIPFYNIYVLNKTANLKIVWTFIVIISGIIGVALNYIGFIALAMSAWGNPDSFDPTIGLMFIIPATIMLLVIPLWNILVCRGLAKSLGLSSAFSVGLFFLLLVCWAIFPLIYR